MFASYHPNLSLHYFVIMISKMHYWVWRFDLITPPFPSFAQNVKQESILYSSVDDFGWIESDRGKG